MQRLEGRRLVHGEAAKLIDNGDTTYGGGRYIDLMKTDVNDGNVMLDFNKAYNPDCAFGEGFSCPIPPAENRLGIAVKAGEKIWSKKTVE